MLSLDKLTFVCPLYFISLVFVPNFAAFFHCILVFQVLILHYVPAVQELEISKPFMHNEIPSAGAHVIDADGATFMCISCHVTREWHGHKSYSPIYYGFYRRDKPVFSSFLPIFATLEVSFKSQLSPASILMVHLVLINHDTAGSCFELTSDFLRPYFPASGFKFCTAVFNISNSSKITRYQSKASAVIQELMSNWTRVVIAITNHTDNDGGDLFVGYEGKKKVYILARVYSVLKIHLSPW
ncbi:uncharacterized protein EDB91DRAFT_1085757 [Suillus paluster]|uniref:uncharacterized protein n=1 Tax=Suillus paluster TaxID=48578 RepID=UPI001B860886|nr:uncharacterized protein EDB91DRAFT_1085757 [Suillus paluster]KAG1729309.1 hypothetical protein EDB91DRAFT_1085757 [Suillus paluster]